MPTMHMLLKRRVEVYPTCSMFTHERDILSLEPLPYRFFLALSQGKKGTEIFPAIIRPPMYRATKGILNRELSPATGHWHHQKAHK